MLRLLSIKCQDHEPGQGWKEDIWELGTSYIGKRGTRYPIIVFYTLNTAYDNRSRSREGGEGESGQNFILAVLHHAKMVSLVIQPNYL